MMDPSAPTAGWLCDKHLSTSCSGKLRVIAAASRVPTKLRDDALISGLHVTQHSLHITQHRLHVMQNSLHVTQHSLRDPNQVQVVL